MAKQPDELFEELGELIEAFGAPEEFQMFELAGALSLLTHRSPGQREQAILALCKMDRDMALIAARAGISDSAESVRGTSAEVLAEVGNNQDIPRLIAALDDKKWTVRSSAADALGYHRNSSSGASLAEHLGKEKHELVRRDIALALARYGSAYAETLQSFLQRERNPIAKVGLQFAVYATNCNSDIREYLENLRHADPVVRKNTVNAIIPYLVRTRDVDFLIKVLTDYTHGETAEGNVWDATAMIASIKLARELATV